LWSSYISYLLFYVLRRFPEGLYKIKIYSRDKNITKEIIALKMLKHALAVEFVCYVFVAIIFIFPCPVA